ncbi:MAG TPA: hypothetical protein VFF84_08450 [Sphingobium sp.]|nr:hypothetical protein [Sphingobium sp.]
MHKHGFVVVLVALALGGGGAMAQHPSPSSAAQAPPSGPGLDLINERCGFCHSVGQVFEKPHNKADWAMIVQSMADRGAEISPAEMRVITDYLTHNFAERPANAPAGTTG